jgi:hypothetical protein
LLNVTSSDASIFQNGFKRLARQRRDRAFEVPAELRHADADNENILGHGVIDWISNSAYWYQK